MVAWQVDATTFKSILMSKSKADAHDYASFIKEVPLLKSLSKEDVRSLLDALEEQAFVAGQQVNPNPNPKPNPNQERYDLNGRVLAAFYDLHLLGVLGSPALLVLVPYLWLGSGF